MTHSRPDFTTCVSTILGLFVACLVLLRFLELSADFPLGLTPSGVLYTDEGWYANAAVRDVVLGHWYVAGDFNPAVNMPLGQLLHRSVFAVLGTSLFSARLSAALAYSVMVAATALVVRRAEGTAAGLLAALLLASSFLGFAYSRLAIMEPVGTAFACSALVLAQRSRGRRTLPLLIGASLFVGAATLVKGTMVFAAFPVACFAGYNRHSSWERLVLPVLCLSIVVLVAGGYQLAAMGSFHQDYAYFNEINLGERLVASLGDWLANIPRLVLRLSVFGASWLMISAVLIAGTAVVSRDFLFRPLALIWLIYGTCYFGLLTLVNYSPPRYFLPLLVPIAALDAMACAELIHHARRAGCHRMLTALPPLLIAGIVLPGCAQISSYMLDLRYSFLRMAAGVERLIFLQQGRVTGVPVLGDVSGSVALQIGVKAINALYGTGSLESRIATHQPAYVLLHRGDTVVLDTVRSLGGHFALLGAWDVYANYYAGGHRVELFEVSWFHAEQHARLRPATPTRDPSGGAGSTGSLEEVR